MNDTEQFEPHPSPPSKSQRKRDAAALQALGTELLELAEADWNALGLQDNLIAALREAARVRAHGARRRQLQYIGKLMRDIDPRPILDYLE
jgi:ribosome-associated protein